MKRVKVRGMKWSKSKQTHLIRCHFYHHVILVLSMSFSFTDRFTPMSNTICIYNSIYRFDCTALWLFNIDKNHRSCFTQYEPKKSGKSLPWLCLFSIFYCHFQMKSMCTSYHMEHTHSVSLQTIKSHFRCVSLKEKQTKNCYDSEANVKGASIMYSFNHTQRERERRIKKFK